MNLETMVPSPAQGVEVLAKPPRRKFPVDYKLRILREADRCKRPGEVGALLRREGLYGSSLARWRRAWEKGEFSGVGVLGEICEADSAAIPNITPALH